MQLVIAGKYIVDLDRDSNVPILFETGGAQLLTYSACPFVARAWTRVCASQGFAATHVST